MLQFSDYISNTPDIQHQNFVQLLEQVSKDYASKDAILYRTYSAASSTRSSAVSNGKQKEFTRWTYSKYGEECRRIAQGLLAAGLVKGDRVVLWAENRPEWMAVWMGTVIAGLIIVPVDFLITNQECINIINITGAKAFFYSGQKSSIAVSLQSIENELIVSVSIGSDESGGGSAADVRHESYYSFGENAAEQILPLPESIKPDDPAAIVFTSGTADFAKGVTLSHKNIIANASAAIRSLCPCDTDATMAVLPLHHTYPTTCTFITPFAVGASVVIPDKIVGKVLVNDIKDARVTFFVAVPLLLDKMMSAIESQYNKLPLIIRYPLNILRKIALKKAEKGRPEFGQKVFMFIRKKAGLQSIKFIVAGGGALSPVTADFYDSLGFNIVHGYGMTENSPLIAVNTTRHKRNESVGLPVNNTEIKILNPSPDNTGEIAIKSPSIMLGYFQNEEATREVIDKDGCLLTGDLGYRDKDGFLFLIGRKKNIIVKSCGKKIHPEEIESCFNNSRIVGEILVVGRKDPVHKDEVIIAIVYPNYETIKEDYLNNANDNNFVKDLVKKEIADINRKLPGYKKIDNFIIRSEPFEKNSQKKIRRYLYKEYENT